MIHQFLLKNKTAVSTQDTGYVDLDLPSGLLWAACNIGAEEPTEYGDYFMWGNTTPDTNNTCKWERTPFNDGHDEFNKKYFESIKNKVCPNGILTPEYDAATVILGPDWRLPTNDEFYELMDNTTNVWVTNYQNSNINGRVFASKTDTSKTLFIPASGCRGGSGCSLRGHNAYLWSSSLNTSSPNCARFLLFDDFYCHNAYDYRSFGFCLRGVKEI